MTGGRRGHSTRLPRRMTGRLFVAVFIAAVVGTGLAIAGRAGAASQAPFFFHTQGDVSYRHAPDKPWSKAAKGMFLQTGGEIETAQGASCEVAFAPGALNIVKIHARSKARLESIEPAVFHIEEGGLYSLLDDLKPGKSFRVASPVATASVRGTGWSQTAAGAFACFTGSLDLDAPSGVALHLKEDEAAEAQGAGFSVPGPIDEETRNAWSAWLAELARRREGKIEGDWSAFDEFGGEFSDTGGAVDEMGDREKVDDRQDDGRGGTQLVGEQGSTINP